MNLRSFAAAAGLLLTAVACGRAPAAFGPANSIIVIVPDGLWATVDDSVHAALEPEIFAVRDEPAFQLTQISPTAPAWRDLRKWKQVLVIGQADDPWVAPALDRQAARSPAAARLVEAADIWARGQRVTALVLPPGGGRADVLATLTDLRDSVDTRYRAYALKRMFASGRDVELRGRLAREAGFALLLPEVYDEQVQGSTYVFRNHYRPDDLARSVLVTWRPGTSEALDPENVLDWRTSVAQEFYDPGQVTGRDEIESRPLERFGARALEVRGIWSSPSSEWPAAGPFISRVIVCPAQDRTYLVDAWLYAPGTDKYEYMLQLETILESFACGDGAGSGQA